MRSRGGSVSKVETKVAADHKRRATAGPASPWGINLIATQMTDPKQPSRQEKSNLNSLQKKASVGVHNLPASSAIPVVQIDEKSFLKSKRSVDKIDRIKNNNNTFELICDKKTLSKHKSTMEEEIKSGSATVEVRK